MNEIIRTCTGQDRQALAEIIRRSFHTVAERFGLTPENAPRHPSNCTAGWICRDMERGAVYFAMESDCGMIGCAAIEAANAGVCYLERLAVLPGKRGRGFGAALVHHALSQARVLEARRVDIGIIAEDAGLKCWYQKIGFTESGLKEFPHLPFRVAFLSYEIRKTGR